MQGAHALGRASRTSTLTLALAPALPLALTLVLPLALTQTLIKSGKAGAAPSKAKTGKRRGHAYVSKAQMADAPSASDKI